MCLVIHRDQKRNEENLIECFALGQETKIVYKVLWKSLYESFYRSINHSDCIWDFKKQQIFEIDRDPKPIELELEERVIKYGLHVYTSIERAKEVIQSFCYGTIVKFLVRKENVVAVHYKYRDLVVEEAICRKLTYVGVVGKDRKK